MVILTHPRSLIEPEVAAAAAAASGDRHGDRRGSSRFWSTATGQLELAELRGGLPIVLARSRIELEPAPAARKPSPAPRQGPTLAWKGEFEPIGFPFSLRPARQLGTVGDELAGLAAQSFDFDESGERILAVERRSSALHVPARRDGGRAFAACRRQTGSRSIPRTEGDRGCGRLRRSRLQQCGSAVLAHYDFPSRTLRHAPDRRRHAVDRVVILSRSACDRAAAGQEDASSWRSISRRRRSRRSATEPARAPSSGHAPASSLYPVMAQAIWTSDSEPWVDLSLRVLRLDADSGLLALPAGPDLKKSVMPLSDGQPALKGGQIVRADRGGDVLAVLVRGGRRAGALLHLDIETATVIGIFPCGSEGGPRTFALSRDGRRFAVLSAQVRARGARGVGPGDAGFRGAKGRGRDPLCARWDGRVCLIREADRGKPHCPRPVA